MPRRRVDHKQRAHLGFGVFPRKDAGDFAQLLHQVLFVVQAARRIHNQQIRLSRLRLLDAVIHHGRRIRAFGMAHERHLRPLCPDFQLIRGRRAECIGRRQHDAVARILKAHGQFADGGGLPHAVDPHNQHDHRPLQRLARPVHRLFQDLLEHLAGTARIGDALLLHALFQLCDHPVARFDAHVAHDEDVHKILVKILIDRFGGLHKLLHTARHVGARFGKALKQPGKNPLLFFILPL